MVVHKVGRVTSLEQLSVAEFSGEYTRLKVYEYDRKRVLGTGCPRAKWFF